MKLKTLTPWKESYDQPRQHIKKQRHYFANKGLSSQSYGFSSSHVWMWELDYKESWAPKNWCFWTVGLEKTLESLLDCKEIQPVYPKGDQSWVFIGRTDAEAETPILWPPDAKSWLIWKNPDAEKDWGQDEKGMTEDEMVGWHHRLNGHGFGWTPGVGDGQGGLACCSSWGHKESDTTEWLNWTELTLWSSEIYPRDQGFFYILKSFNVIHHNNKLRDKNHIIFSIAAKTAFDTIQHSFMITTTKNSPESGLRANMYCALLSHSVMSNSLRLHGL